MEYLIYLAIYNIAVLLLFGLDKLFAKMKARRVPEKTLISLSFIGGAYGALCGMVLFHHKISKPLFRYLVSSLFIVQTGVFIWLFMSGSIQ